MEELAATVSEVANQVCVNAQRALQAKERADDVGRQVVFSMQAKQSTIAIIRNNPRGGTYGR